MTGDFYFLAIDGNEFIEINYLDDLLGIYSAEDAVAWGIPEGLPSASSRRTPAQLQADARPRL